mgnify:CR=1 FL=1
MTDTEAAIEILTQDILSLIVTFETNFNEVISSIHYDNWSKDTDFAKSINDIQVYLVDKIENNL